MDIGRLSVSRTFAVIAVVSAAVVVSLTTSLWRGDGTASRRFSPSQRLIDSYLALLCRPPNDAETLRWDTKSFTMSELAASVRSTAESVRVRAIRRAFIDVLLRDPVKRGCSELREWADRPTAVQDIARRLAASPEARRVNEVRRLLATVQRRDPGGWDNASVRRWAETALTPAEIAARVTEKRPLVGVHYFAWYQQDSRGWGNGATSVPADTPRPSLGWYTSNDVAVMDAHIAQITNAGFDFVLFQIVAASPDSWATAHRFFSRLEGTRLRAAVMLDGLYTAPITLTAAAIEKARAAFAAHPNYLWLEDTPLVLLYSGRMDFPVPGVTLRNIYWTGRYDPGANSFNPDGLLYPHDWPFWSPTPPPLVNGVVPVLPGYSDTHLGRTEAMEYPRNNGRMYHEQWQRALALRPEFVIVYSWNEHFDWTAIEPTDAWGEQYLQLTACYVAHAHAGREGSC